MGAFVLMPRTSGEWLANVRITASFIAWLAVLLGALAVIARFSLKDVPGGRLLWKLWRYLIADPLHRRRVASLAAAMKDALDAVESRVLAELSELRTENTAEHHELWQRLDSLEARTAVIEATTSVHATLIDHGTGRLDQMVAQNGHVLTALGQLSKEVKALRATQLANSPKEASDAQ